MYAFIPTARAVPVSGLTRCTARLKKLYSINLIFLANHVITVTLSLIQEGFYTSISLARFLLGAHLIHEGKTAIWKVRFGSSGSLTHALICASS